MVNTSRRNFLTLLATVAATTAAGLVLPRSVLEPLPVMVQVPRSASEAIARTHANAGRDRAIVTRGGVTVGRHRALREALEAAEPGDTILVMHGDHFHTDKDLNPGWYKGNMHQLEVAPDTHVALLRNADRLTIAEAEAIKFHNSDFIDFDRIGGWI